MSIVCNRTKTVVRRHVAPGEAIPLHLEAVGFAGHYDSDIRLNRLLCIYVVHAQANYRSEGRVLCGRDTLHHWEHFEHVGQSCSLYCLSLPGWQP